MDIRRDRSCEPAVVTVLSIITRVWRSLVVVMLLVGAGGTSESRLEQAQALIEAKEYNQAILLLSSLVDEKPEFLDRAQALIDDVFQIKEEYSNTLDELVETLTVAEDPALALQLIDRLEEIDPNPNDEVSAQLAQARERVSVLFLREALAATMDAAAVELAASNYAGAITLFIDGYTVFEQRFDGSQYGNLVVAAVARSTERLIAAANETTELQQQVADVALAIQDEVAEGRVPSVDQARLLMLPTADSATRSVAAGVEPRQLAPVAARAAGATG